MLNKIKRIGLLSAVLTGSALSAVTLKAGTGDFAKSVSSILDKGQTYIKLGLLVAAVYGGYKLFIADDKSVLNWFLFGAGAGGLGAYKTIAEIFIDFLAVT